MPNLIEESVGCLFQLYREAEITHGRVAMLASLGFVVGEAVNPLFNGAITGMF